MQLQFINGFTREGRWLSPTRRIALHFSVFNYYTWFCPGPELCEKWGEKYQHSICFRCKCN